MGQAPASQPSRQAPSFPFIQQTFGILASSSLASSFNALAKAEKHTRFLSTLVEMDPTVKKPDGFEFQLEKARTQVDQGSDMTVISKELVRLLGLFMYQLSDIGFKALSMRTADHRDTVLE